MRGWGCNLELGRGGGWAELGGVFLEEWVFPKFLKGFH